MILLPADHSANKSLEADASVVHVLCVLLPKQVLLVQCGNARECVRTVPAFVTKKGPRETLKEAWLGWGKRCRS